MTPIIKTKCGEQYVPHLIPSIQKKKNVYMVLWVERGLLGLMRSARLLPLSLLQTAVTAVPTYTRPPLGQSPGSLHTRLQDGRSDSEL